MNDSNGIPIFVGDTGTISGTVTAVKWSGALVAVKLPDFLRLSDGNVVAGKPIDLHQDNVNPVTVGASVTRTVTVTGFLGNGDVVVKTADTTPYAILPSEFTKA